MLNPSLETAPFLGDLAQLLPRQYGSYSHQRALPGSVYLLCSLYWGGEVSFVQQCEERLYLFGDTVYSAWRVWRLSPREILHGNISLLRAGRYWWPQMKWTGNFDEPPEGSMLNMAHRNSTPDDYSRAEPEYNPPVDLTFAVS